VEAEAIPSQDCYMQLRHWYTVLDKMFKGGKKKKRGGGKREKREAESCSFKDWYRNQVRLGREKKRKKREGGRKEGEGACPFQSVTFADILSITGVV